MKSKVRKMIRSKIRIASGIVATFLPVEDPTPALFLALNPLHNLTPHLNLSLHRDCNIVRGD